MREKEQRLAELVNEVCRLKTEKADAMKGWKEAIDAAQSAVEQKKRGFQDNEG